MKDDTHLWDAFRDGDDQALSHIYSQYVDSLFCYGKKFVRDESFLLDVLQDLFYDLIRNRNTLGATDNIQFYLLKSFRRRLFRELERKQQEKHFFLHDSDGWSKSMEEEMIQSEMVRHQLALVRSGLEKLNHRQREVLYYKFHYGFDYDQICEMMSISSETARQMVSRAIHTLKKEISAQTGLQVVVLFKLFLFFL